MPPLCCYINMDVLEKRSLDGNQEKKNRTWLVSKIKPQTHTTLWFEGDKKGIEIQKPFLPALTAIRSERSGTGIELNARSKKNGLVGTGVSDGGNRANTTESASFFSTYLSK